MEKRYTLPEILELSETLLAFAKALEPKASPETQPFDEAQYEQAVADLKASYEATIDELRQQLSNQEGLRAAALNEFQTVKRVLDEKNKANQKLVADLAEATKEAEKQKNVAEAYKGSNKEKNKAVRVAKTNEKTAKEEADRLRKALEESKQRQLERDARIGEIKKELDSTAAELETTKTAIAEAQASNAGAAEPTLTAPGAVTAGDLEQMLSQLSRIETNLLDAPEKSERTIRVTKSFITEKLKEMQK
ncbi:hypothetical protein VVR46_08165 [Corynebacterium phoceense]|uniref:hypothetical protein n=1 Tax=Corynebacterium phoceense TaxID=1686286 RepID=UPI0034CE3A49